MKTKIYLKVFLVLPLIIFTDWVLMAVLGCTSCLFGFSDSFYCGSYCLFGKGILLLSAVFFIYLITPDLKQFLSHKKNAASNSKP